VEVVEQTRHTSTDGPVAGEFAVPTAGTLAFSWDNRFSYLRGKTLTIRFTCTLSTGGDGGSVEYGSGGGAVGAGDEY
jgi:hypothetical protein